MTNTSIPPGWIGGFPPQGSPMRYPDPDLSSLPMTGNLDNINLLQRQLPVKWPEFSWETRRGENDPRRCYQMFAPYISRIGYTDKGRAYSIICPQQGVWLLDEICLNVEVTVTGQRGWVNEFDDPSQRQIAADITVEPKIWLSPSQHQGNKLKAFWPLLEYGAPHFPLSKAKAMRLNTFHPGNPHNPLINVRDGQTTDFPIPDFATHEEHAYMVGNLEVEIGTVIPTPDQTVNDFNVHIMEAFNLGSGNMLQEGNTLAWNVWFTQPELVNQHEWAQHAEFWRHSIDVNHKYPDGAPGTAKYFDGTPFKPLENAAQELLDDLWEYIEHLLKHGKL